VAKFLSERGAELNAPLAQRLVAYLYVAPVEQFLDVSVAEWKAVVQPNGVLDDGHGKAVAVGLGVGHRRSAYPKPAKATQPDQEVGINWEWQAADGSIVNAPLGKRGAQVRPKPRAATPPIAAKRGVNAPCCVTPTAFHSQWCSAAPIAMTARC